MRKATQRSSKKWAVLAALPEKNIKLDDVPEVRDWSGAVVGKFIVR